MQTPDHVDEFVKVGISRVGLIGHRPDGLSENRLAAIAKEIEDVLECVEDAMADWKEKFGRDQLKIAKRFTCGLAAGSDTIGAKVARRRGWSLQAALPVNRSDFKAISMQELAQIPRHTYGIDFDFLVGECESVMELEGNAIDPRAFEWVGQTILRHSDILIAVWDGEPERGPGGTAQIIRRGRTIPIPVVWIHAKETVPLQIELPEQAVVHDIALLRDWLRKQCEASAALDCIGQESKENAVGIKASSRRRISTHIESALLRAFGFFGARRTQTRRPNTNWTQYEAMLDRFDPKMGASVKNALHENFLRADGLANLYGSAYRGTFSSVYLLSAIATVVGLLSLFIPEYKAILVMAELVLIIMIMSITATGARYEWHETWLRHRTLAERLRLARVGIWCGYSTQTATSTDDSDAASVAYHVKACSIQVPLPNAIISNDYINAAVKTIRELDIKDQIEFNNVTAIAQRRIHNRLELIENGVLCLLVLACLAFLWVYRANLFDFSADQLKHLGHAMTFMGAAIPALGAALLGLRSQGEYRTYADRCMHTSAVLSSLITRIEPRGIRGEADAFYDLVDLIESTQATLGGDIIAWHALYRPKELTAAL